MRNFRIWFLKPACQTGPPGGIMDVTCLFRTATKQRRCALSDTLSARVLLGERNQHMSDTDDSTASRYKLLRFRWQFVTAVFAGLVLSGHLRDYLKVDVGWWPQIKASASNSATASRLFLWGCRKEPCRISTESVQSSASRLPAGAWRKSR